MNDSQIESQIHKLTSEISNQSISVGPVMCSMPNYSAREGAAMFSLPIQSTCEEAEAYVISDGSSQEDATRIREPVVPRAVVKGDHTFKTSITEEVPLLFSHDFSQFVERKLIVTRR